MTIKIDRDKFRSNFLKFTRRAYQMLPSIESPKILDIGCGSGIPTMELATISGGHVTGIDTNGELLNRLREKSVQSGMSDRILAIEMSMQDLEFEEESFDIIWAEGSIYAIGFERGLKEWKPLIRRNGFLVIHDENEHVEEKIAIISELDFHLIGHFEVSYKDWWNGYYKPIVKYIEDTREELDNTDVEQMMNEIQNFKKNKTSSVYFIMQKL